MFGLKNKKFWGPCALLVLRLAIGSGFVVHGWAKLERGPEKFAGVLAWIGSPLPHLMAWVVTLIELLGGFAMAAGAFVTLIGMPLIAIHLVALATIHWKYGFSSVRTIGLSADGPQFGPPGYEISLLYIAGLLVILCTRSLDRLSLDRLREKSNPRNSM